MIYESTPWKNDLNNWTAKLEERANKFDTRAYITIEKSIFCSAFIIRKLFDCKTKITKQTTDLKIQALKYEVSPEEINLIKRYVNEEIINCIIATSETIPLRYICNALIHSTIFDVCCDSNRLIGFFVASDKTINQKKLIYFIQIEDWISSAKLVANDQIKTLHLAYDKGTNNYIAEAD